MVWRNNEFCYATKVDWPWWTSQTRALPEQRTAVHHTFCRCIRAARRRHSSTTWFCAVCPRRTVGCTVPMATIPPRPDTPEWQTKMWATVYPTRMNGMPFSNSRCLSRNSAQEINSNMPLRAGFGTEHQYLSVAGFGSLMQSVTRSGAADAGS